MFQQILDTKLSAPKTSEVHLSAVLVRNPPHQPHTAKTQIETTVNVHLLLLYISYIRTFSHHRLRVFYIEGVQFRQKILKQLFLS